MSGTAGGSFRLAAAALGISLACLPGSLAAVDCSAASDTVGISYGAVFNLSTSGFSQEELETSIDYWDLCSGYGSLMPSIMVGGSGGIPIQVKKVAGTSTADGGDVAARFRRSSVASSNRRSSRSGRSRQTARPVCR